MTGYFDRCRTRMKNVDHQIAEIHQMMVAMYQRYESEQGLKLGAPPPFSLDRYAKEFQRIEGLYQKHFDTLFAMLTTEAMTLLQRFLDTIATQIRRVFTHASREAKQWFRELIAPIELQIRERQQQLRRRLASIKQVHDTTDALEERLRDLEQAANRERGHVDEMQRLSLDLHDTLTLEDNGLAAAA